MTHLHTHTHNNSLTEPSSSCHTAAMIPTDHRSIITLGSTYGASLSEFEAPTRAWPDGKPLRPSVVVAVEKARTGSPVIGS